MDWNFTHFWCGIPGKLHEQKPSILIHFGDDREKNTAHKFGDILGIAYYWKLGFPRVTEFQVPSFGRHSTWPVEDEEYQPRREVLLGNRSPRFSLKTSHGWF